MSRIAAVLLFVSSFYFGNPHHCSGQEASTFLVESKIDQAVAKYGVSGKGVVVGILDRGIDYKHPDFINDDGTTRIAWLLDLTDNSGANAPNNPYKEGTVYSKADIDAALRGERTLNTVERFGHGIATAGIAAGNGRGLPSRKYRGAAPQAQLIIVKVTQDAFPAFDNQPGQAGFYDGRLVPVAMDFTRDKARSMGLPCVMLLNIGSTTGGPADGTSLLARKVDELTGPGMIFVTGPGDEGAALQNHIAGTVAKGQDGIIRFEKVSAAGTLLRIELFYDGTDRFDVVMQTPTGTSDVLPSPSNTERSTKQTTEYVLYHSGTETDIFGATSNRREIFIDVTGPPGSYALTLRGTTVQTGAFFGWLNPAYYNASSVPKNRFTTYVVPGGTIWDMASAKTNLSPNSYVYRTQWTDIDGVQRSSTNEGALGDLWAGSSVGPTSDGRLGVTISSPGEKNFTSYSPNTYYSSFRFNLIQDGNGLYGIQSAVSGAAPVFTGAVALMLEKLPTLDPAAIKDILSKTARQDQFTGNVPNANWGYGKLDVLAALDEIAKRTNCLVPEITGTITGAGQACTGKQDYSVPATTGVQYTWAVTGGEQVVGTGAAVSVNWSKPGTYTLTVAPSSNCGNGTARPLPVTVQTVPGKPSITYANNQLSSSATTNNQWFRDGQAIAGATSPTYAAVQSGNYTVQTANDCGKSASSDPYIITITAVDPTLGEPLIFPNPVKEYLTIRLADRPDVLRVQLIGNTGQVVKSQLFRFVNEAMLSVQGLSPGSYSLEIISENRLFRRKLLIN